MSTKIQIFICYVHEKDNIRMLHELLKSIATLQRHYPIVFFYDGDISAGAEWEREIKEHLDTAQIILLLISPSFLASDFCSGVEMKRALERHECGEAYVIPLILYPALWQYSPIAKLQVLPLNGEPISQWRSRDAAWVSVGKGIVEVIEKLVK